ncbi:oligosaccharide flippase family protein [Porticoccus sp.]|nr:oligosaccharide flippase family protein [Porticoccus sp.]
MLRDFFKDSIIYTIPTVLSRGIALLLLPLYTRILSPTEYGVLDLFVVFGSLVNLTVALEISQGIARYYADGGTAQNKTLYASTAFWFTCACYLLFAVVSLTNVAWLAEAITGRTGYEKAFNIMILFLTVNGLFYLVQNQFRFELRSQTYCIVSIIFSLVTTASAIIFIFVFKLGLEGILLGMLTGSLVATTIGICNLRESFRPKFSPKHLKEMLVFSMPLVPSGIAVFVSLYIDRVMLSHFYSLNEVGIYSVAYRLACISGIVMLGFQGALTPLVYKHHKDIATPGHLASIFRFFLVFALLVFLSLVLFAKEILWALTTQAYYPAGALVIYMVPAVLLANMYIFSPGISIANKTKYILYINVSGAALNALLNWLLIPNLGMQGAAIATLLASLFVFLCYMISSQIFYYVHHQWKQIIVSVLFIFLLAALGPFLVSNDNSFIWIILSKLSLIFCGATLIVLTGLVKLDEIKRILKVFQTA